MAKELFDTEPVFAATLTRCAEVLDGVLEKPLLDVIFGADEDTLRQTSYAQPALFAVEMGLARLGSPGVSNPTWCWVTASGSTRRPAWPESSASGTAPG